MRSVEISYVVVRLGAVSRGGLRRSSRGQARYVWGGPSG